MIAENIWNEEHGIPTRYEIARDLLEMPARIQRAETDLHAAKLRVVAEKDALADREADLLIGTNSTAAFVDCTNAEKRKAMLLRLTEAERENLRNAEAALLLLERSYNREINEFRSLRAVAALIAGEDR